MATAAAPPPNAIEVAWICPLKLEVDACRGAFTKTFDDDSTDYKEKHGLPLIADTNNYYFGKINQFNVVLCQPGDERGGQRVAYTAYHEMKSSFLKIKYLFLVGVAGGVPRSPSDHDLDIRLGDVVLGLPAKGHSGVTQIDGGWKMDLSLPIPTMPIYPPNGELVQWAREVRKAHETPGSSAVGRLSQTVDTIRDNLPADAQLASGLSWEYPGIEYDILFPRRYECHSQINNRDHRNWCPAKCDRQRRVKGRLERVTGNKVQTIHCGLICSVDIVVMDANFRDETAKKIYDGRKRAEVLCFEMEGYGIAETVSILQVRGICDYSDKHKSKRWQPYAALQAAAVARLIMDRLSRSIHQFNVGTTSRANTIYPGSIMSEIVRANIESNAEHSTVPLFAKEATAEPSEYGDAEDASLKRRFTEGQDVMSNRQPNNKLSDMTRSATTPGAGRGEIGEAFRPHRVPLRPQPMAKIHRDDKRKHLNEFHDTSESPLASEDSHTKSMGDSQKSKRHSTQASYKLDKGKNRMPSIAGSPAAIYVAAQKRPDPPIQIPIYETEHVERVVTNIYETNDSIDEPSLIDSGETVPEFYRTTEPFPRNGIVHECRFKVYIKNLDDSCDYPRYQTIRHGLFKAEWTIEDCDLDSEIMSKRLFFRPLNGKGNFCFWVPVDGVTVLELGDAADRQYLYCWSDCEAYNVKHKDYLPYPYFCYNASEPNIQLRIRFDNQQAEDDFRRLMINWDLGGSKWESVGEPHDTGEMVDCIGRSLRLFRKKRTSDRSPFWTEFLIAADETDDDGGSRLKLYRLRDFNIFELPSEAQTVFKITGLKVLNYFTEILGQEDDTRFQCKSVRGEPLYQSWEEHEENSFFKRKTTGSDLSVVLPYKVFGDFLNLVLSWKLDCYTSRARLVPSNVFNSSIEGSIMFGHSKDESSKCHLMCYNAKASEWNILEVEKSQTENKEETRKKKISLQISKWATLRTMKAGQFKKLDKRATCRTIHFKVDDEFEKFCDALRTSEVWPLRRSNTRTSSILSRR